MDIFNNTVYEIFTTFNKNDWTEILQSKTQWHMPDEPQSVFISEGNLHEKANLASDSLSDNLNTFNKLVEQRLASLKTASSNPNSDQEGGYSFNDFGNLVDLDHPEREFPYYKDPEVRFQDILDEKRIVNSRTATFIRGAAEVLSGPDVLNIITGHKPNDPALVAAAEEHVWREFWNSPSAAYSFSRFPIESVSVGLKWLYIIVNEDIKSSWIKRVYFKTNLFFHKISRFSKKTLSTVLYKVKHFLEN